MKLIFRYSIEYGNFIFSMVICHYIPINILELSNIYQIPNLYHILS